MTTQTLVPLLTPQFFDNNGAPLASGQLSSYQSGTSTPAVTYTDSTGLTPNTNPIILNARGEASVWIPPNVGYKFVLQDSQGNTIWTRDAVVNSQLITLYGGVDTGTANAYILNFTANFTAYTDGIVIYWKAANTNTGASTLNVNGLGVVNILQQNGNPLGLSSIVANSIVQVMYIGGSFYLLTAASTAPQTGTFPLVVNGLTNPLTVTGSYSVLGTQVTVTVPYLPTFTNASNSTSFSLTGLPSFLEPALVQQLVNIPYAQDNGSPLTTAYALFSPGSSTIVLVPSAGGTATSWTASGTKVLGRNALPNGLYGTNFTYPLS